MENNTAQTHSTEPQAMNIQQAVDAAKAIGIDQLDAQLLLLFALGRSAHERAWLLAHNTDALLQSEHDQYMALLQRRAIGVPTAYLTGEKEFYGLSFSVDKRVLVPRPETETLVEWVIELMAQSDALVEPAIRVLDLGTGSGIVAITLKYLEPQIIATAVDASADALTVASLNAADLLPADASMDASTNPPIRFLQGSWLEPVAGERFNFIVSNPPYIAQADEHLPALMHEPQEALVSGADGLDAIRHIVHHAGKHLLPNGRLLLEHGYDQGEAVRTLLTQAGFTDVQTRQDLAGIDRITGGQLTHSNPA